MWFLFVMVTTLSMSTGKYEVAYHVTPAETLSYCEKLKDRIDSMENITDDKTIVGETAICFEHIVGENKYTDERLRGI